MSFREKMARFMIGRYGIDQLSRCINVVALVALVLAIVVSFFSQIVSNILWAFAVILIIYNYFRMFSRNIYKRAAENQKFLNTKAHFAQRKTHCFYRCPKCKTKVRVPRHKGKIRITCPLCKEEFIRKT